AAPTPPPAPSLHDALPICHDHPPAHVVCPYSTFGRTTIHDWSTSTEDGTEHIFTVHVWSKEKGKAQALEIIEIARTVLHDTDLRSEEHTSELQSRENLVCR